MKLRKYASHKENMLKYYRLFIFLYNSEYERIKAKQMQFSRQI